MDNLELYKFSIKNAEEHNDKLYKKELIIITKAKEEMNKLIENNKKILDYITAFEILEKLKNNNKNKLEIIKNIIKLLETKGINNSEFTNYRCIYDMSYSSYDNMPYSEKIKFLMFVVPEYIKKDILCINHIDIQPQHYK